MTDGLGLGTNHLHEKQGWPGLDQSKRPDLHSYSKISFLHLGSSRPIQSIIWLGIPHTEHHRHIHPLFCRVLCNGKLHIHWCHNSRAILFALVEQTYEITTLERDLRMREEFDCSYMLPYQFVRSAYSKIRFRKSWVTPEFTPASAWDTPLTATNISAKSITSRAEQGCMIPSRRYPMAQIIRLQATYQGRKGVLHESAIHN